MYCLIDEAGHVTPPKDLERREIAFTPAEMTALRQRAFADATSMYEAGVPLSARWLRQITVVEAQVLVAEVVEARQDQLEAQGVRRSSKKRGSWEIESITDRKSEWSGGVKVTKYLVTWAGYHPSWEAWRLQGLGAVGDPVATWEPWSKVKSTEALSTFIATGSSQ